MIGRIFLRKVAVIPLTFLALVFTGCMRSPEAKSARYMENGKKLMEKNDAQRAILEFQNAARSTPRKPEIYYQLGLAYLAAGDARNGVACLRKAIELNPKHRGAQLRLAQLMAGVQDSGVLKDAQERLQALLEGDADDPNALHALALTELKLGETDEGIQHLETALANAPQELMIAITLVQAKLQQRDVKGAEAVLLKVCAEAPKSADARVVLGRFYRSQKRNAEAAQQFQQASTIDAKSGIALFNLALVQYEMGQKQEAEQSFQRLSGFPQFKPVYALFLFREGRKDEAIREFERLAKADPDDRRVRTRLVAAYRAATRDVDAERTLNQALKKNPKDLDALLQRGEMSLAAGKYKSADSDLNQVLRLEPSAPEVHYVLARLYQARGEAGEYRQELIRTLELNRYLLPVRLELIHSQLASSPQAAMAILNEAPKSQQESAPFLVERNWIFWTLGDMASMRKGIDQGLAHFRSADLLIQDGLWKLRSGDADHARASLEEALKINPTDLRGVQALSQTYISQKNMGLALQKLKEYAVRQPKSAPIQNYLGILLLVNGDQSGARAAFSAAKLADPKSVDADLHLVWLDVGDHNLEQAKKRLEAIISSGTPP
jgi:tetratricopeptide (TPR) repeat protein